MLNHLLGLAPEARDVITASRFRDIPPHFTPVETP
jgi:hypothetical protein